VNDTSFGRSDTESCWLMMAQIFSDHVLPLAIGHVVLQNLVLLIYSCNKMMMMMDELTLTWHIVLRLQGHVTVKKESRNSRRVS